MVDGLIRDVGTVRELALAVYAQGVTPPALQGRAGGDQWAHCLRGRGGGAGRHSGG